MEPRIVENKTADTREHASSSFEIIPQNLRAANKYKRANPTLQHGPFGSRTPSKDAGPGSQFFSGNDSYAPGYPGAPGTSNGSFSSHLQPPPGANLLNKPAASFSDNSSSPSSFSYGSSSINAASSRDSVLDHTIAPQLAHPLPAKPAPSVNVKQSEQHDFNQDRMDMIRNDNGTAADEDIYAVAANEELFTGREGANSETLPYNRLGTESGHIDDVEIGEVVDENYDSEY